jgi:F-box/leucine-rich repeat protein 7
VQFLNALIEYLGTCFTVPEENIISQYEEVSHEMYFIIQGDCVVNIRDHRGREHVALRLLTEGQHFGEIGIMYKCPRSCTVVSRNYNMMARLSAERYRMLISDSPMFKKYMTKHVFKYRDPNMIFIKKVINQISYLREIDDKGCLYDLIFNMKRSSHG